MLYKRVYINRVYGQRQTIDYEGNLKRSVSYSQTTAAIVGGSVPSDDRYTVTSTRTYGGPHIFTDGALEYSSFEGGYIDPAKGVMYYITDWQGNNAAVIDKSGDIVQSTTYYPYGEPTIEPQGQRFLFGGKEREHAGGRNSYDFGARNLAANAWTTPDPLAEKFYPLSPYSYCGGDPINYVDPDGKNIAVLLLNGAIGHLGLLIQQADESWAYYSINGDKIYESTNGFAGGGPTNDVGKGSWVSPQEFINEAHKTTEAERETNPDGISNYNYTEAYEIETTPEQDKIIANEFSKIAEENYDLITNNCAHAVQRSLQKAGILPRYSNSIFYPSNLGYGVSVSMPMPLIVHPHLAYNYIKQQIPNGKIISNPK